MSAWRAVAIPSAAGLPRSLFAASRWLATRAYSSSTLISGWAVVAIPFTPRLYDCRGRLT